MSTNAFSCAGVAASYPDEAYKEAGAKVVGEVLDKADIVLSVRGPEQGQASALKKGAAVIALLDPHREKDLLQALAKSGATAFTIAPTSSLALLAGMVTSSRPSASSRMTDVMDRIGREMLRAMR